MITFLSIGLTFILFYPNFFSETDLYWHLDNGTMKVTISKISGEITAITLKGKNLVSNPCMVNTSIDTKQKNGEIIKQHVNNRLPYYCQIYIKKDYFDKSVAQKFMIDSLTLYWEISIVSKIVEDREMCIDFSLPLIKTMQCMFTPTEGMPLSLKNSKIKKVIYRRNTTIPITTFYNDIYDYGLSVIAPLEVPKPGLSFSTDEEKLVVSFNHLRLTNNRKTKAALYIAPHEGGWRPGLNFLLNKYPEYFYPKIENTKIDEGWYTQASPRDNQSIVKKVVSKGVTWSEFHYYFPFYGLYIPKMQNWSLVANSDDIGLSEWEAGAGVKKNSQQKVKDIINLWHKYGIQVYLYFQIFEAWHQYAEKYFADDIARKKDNNPIPSWKFTNLMNPDPSSKWGKHIINQAKKLIKKYPEIDGIFYDRMDYWNYDFAHNDGITMINNKPAYMLGFAQEKINEKLFDFFHKHKKGIWGNGPTSVEVCKNLDGIMAETHISSLYKIQYLGLVRPIIFLAYDRKPEDTENKLKNALLCGAFPSITYGENKCQNLDAKYRPLFDLMLNRQWVLSKKPLEIPEEFKSNIFQTPEGDYVAVIVSTEKSQLVPHPFEYSIPVKIQIPDVDEIDYVYLLSGDWEGINYLNYKKVKGVITLNLPYHLSLSLIYLTKKSKSDLLRLSSPILLKGKNEVLRFLNKIPNASKSFLRIETPWFSETREISSDTIEFATNVPMNIAGEVEIKVLCKDKTYRFSSWVLEPISIAPLEDIFIHDKKGEYVPFCCVNNTVQKIIVDLKSKLTVGAGKIDTPTRIMLKPFENKKIELFVNATKEGLAELIGKYDKGKFIRSFKIKTGLAFGKDDLFHDDFQHGMKKWTIDRGEWKISKGIAQGGGSAHFAIIQNYNWQDYLLEVTTRCRGSDNPAVDWLKSYIFFRVRNNKNFYRFGIHGDADLIDLYKCVSGNWIKLNSSSFEPKKDKWYSLRIKVDGPKIIGYVDGEKVIEANDNTFSSGGVGIGVLEDAIRCDYKDVIVKRL